MQPITYQPKYRESWALVIGINGYKNATPLNFACNDADAVATTLVNTLEFQKSNVVVLKDDQATKKAIQDVFLDFKPRTQADDRLFFFFAGHGETIPGHRGPVGYLVPVEGEFGQPSTLVRWDELTRNAEVIPAKHILFVMDACYSGLAIQRGAQPGEQRFVSDMLQRFSRQVITAGKADETVADAGGPSGNNSLFTAYLIEGMSGRAANEQGVITANYLMDYVYRKVANDSRSRQTPHFGHLEGDGDFVIQTPKGEHLFAGPSGDYIVKTIVEHPEPVGDTVMSPIRPIFADKNGYADPERPDFGHNEWSNKLGVVRRRVDGSPEVVRPQSWMALVLEPVSNQPISVDIAKLAQTLPQQQQRVDKPYEQFPMPKQAITTAKSVILFDGGWNPEHTSEDCWQSYVRIEKSGCIEYCNSHVFRVFSPVSVAVGTKCFLYVQIIGFVWNFLFAAKKILSQAGYESGARFLVNLIGTRDTILADFAAKPGVDDRFWSDPLKPDMFPERYERLRCRDASLQIPFKFVLAHLTEIEVQKITVEIANQLGLAYNHQSLPRCFNYGTDVFPWEQFVSRRH